MKNRKAVIYTVGCLLMAFLLMGAGCPANDSMGSFLCSDNTTQQGTSAANACQHHGGPSTGGNQG